MHFLLFVLERIAVTLGLFVLLSVRTLFLLFIFVISPIPVLLLFLQIGLFLFLPHNLRVGVLFREDVLLEALRLFRILCHSLLSPRSVRIPLVAALQNMRTSPMAIELTHCTLCEYATTHVHTCHGQDSWMQSE